MLGTEIFYSEWPVAPAGCILDRCWRVGVNTMPEIMIEFLSGAEKRWMLGSLTNYMVVPVVPGLHVSCCPCSPLVNKSQPPGGYYVCCSEYHAYIRAFAESTLYL